MINPNEDYEQDKVKGAEKQTVIINEQETAETDELDPKFSESEGTAINKELDGEGIDEAKAGLNPAEQETDLPVEDAGLNRDANDDMSLNKSEDDIF